MSATQPEALVDLKFVGVTAQAITHFPENAQDTTPYTPISRHQQTAVIPRELTAMQ
ncbi:hypothetical protein N9Z14_02325 [Opitutales bacterium]|nr:hypothetical protein [Opitutales bacterium]MDB2681412.1 hypothetical protein [Opitutales bacterium]